jgi:hypothetical protein
MNAREQLINLGIYPNLQGFYYILEAVEIMQNTKEHIKTMDIYELVAKVYNKSITQIERNIRHVIEVAYKKGTIKEKYRVGEFLALLSESVNVGNYLN